MLYRKTVSDYTTKSRPFVWFVKNDLIVLKHATNAAPAGGPWVGDDYALMRKQWVNVSVEYTFVCKGVRSAV